MDGDGGSDDVGLTGQANEHKERVLGRLAVSVLLFFAFLFASRFAGLSEVTSVIVAACCLALVEYGLLLLREKWRRADMAAGYEKQLIAEEDARVAREKALARAKASGAFDRFGSS